MDDQNKIDGNDKIITSLKNNTIKINKWKVHEGFQVSNNQVILLYELVDDNDKEIKKLKASDYGVVKRRLFKDGDVVDKGEPLLELAPCIHTTVIKDMCADCGADLRQEENGNTSEASVPMIHSVPELKVTQKLAQKLGKADTVRLLQDQKLVLLVDLDQTLIHTTNDNIPNNLKGVYHFQLYGVNSPWYHTRLRPGTFAFLNNVAPYFELHICTFGARNYAHTIAQFLDEDGKYFSHRILSRDECFNATSKTDNLKALFPCGDSMVCIIDDREDVWNMASNLIQVKPYHFFQHTGDINAPPGLAKHELDGKGVDFSEMFGKEDKKTKDTKIEENSMGSENDSKDDANDGQGDGNEKSTKTDSLDPTDEKMDELKISDVNEMENVNETDNGCNEDLADAGTLSDSRHPDDLQKQCNSDSDSDNLVDVEDSDDYLLYLETILLKIHKRFYKLYNESKQMADLKMLIPQIRREVLVDKVLVFSGLVPNHLKLEQSSAYLVAKSLGATVNQQLTYQTTHLVAAAAGTFKVNAARKRSQIKIVTPDWLWSCAERWECVEEQLFPLDPHKPSKMRRPPAHCHSPEHVVNYNVATNIAGSSVDSSLRKEDQEPKFIDTMNPLLSFSNADLAAMNQDFNQCFESESSSEDEPGTDYLTSTIVEESISKKRKRTTDDTDGSSSDIDDDENQSVKSVESDLSSEDNETKFRRGDLPSEYVFDMNSVGSDEPLEDAEEAKEWVSMGEELEREFMRN